MKEVEYDVYRFCEKKKQVLGNDAKNHKIVAGTKRANI